MNKNVKKTEIIEPIIQWEFIIEKIRCCDLLLPETLQLLNGLGKNGYELKNITETYIDLTKYNVMIFTKIK